MESTRVWSVCCSLKCVQMVAMTSLDYDRTYPRHGSIALEMCKKRVHTYGTINLNATTVGDYLLMRIDHYYNAIEINKLLVILFIIIISLIYI